MTTLREAAQQALEAIEDSGCKDDLMAAADALRAALAEQEDDLIAAWMAGAAEERKRAEQQRDALLEALKSTGLFLHHCWCDVQMNDYSFEKLNQQMAVVDAAIKQAEGEKE